MSTDSSNLIVIEGSEQALVEPVPPLADAGLPPAPGVRSYQVFRASKAAKTDELGYTYHHHVDMAIWRGRLYVGWNCCEKDEDVWPSRELYSTSTDGVKWDEPRELFPQGASTPLRIYFYLAKNGVMLAIAGFRADTNDTSEHTKGALVVRRLNDNHELGPVYRTPSPFKTEAAAATLPTTKSRSPLPETWTRDPIPSYESAEDSALIAAMREMLDNRVYLEQQDLGRLLGEKRMPWHDPANWPGGKVPGDNAKWVAGKAYSFFVRPDGLRVGISKMGWCTSTTDNGLNWAQPAVPTSLITGKAKVWSQKTSDGRYALVYNPTRRTRYPLIAVTGDDGTRFSHMRIVQGELPVQRYPGRDRSIGPQYIRGVSEWSDDGSRAGEQCMWLVYSMSKEDIWVSRVPIPIPDDASGEWILYQPRWTNIDQSNDALALTSRDPHDYAAATRVFPKSSKTRVTFAIQAAGAGTMSIDLLSEFGSKRPVQLTIRDGVLFAGEERNADLQMGKWAEIALDIDASRQTFSLAVNGKTCHAPFNEPCEDIQRVTFRTGAYRNIGGAKPVDEASDVMQLPRSLSIRTLRIEKF